MLMKMIADLHIHSRFSMATSKEGTPENLDFWARKKGISLIGTGDFTHPVWREELKERLVSEGNGLYRLREYQIAILRDKYEYLGEKYCTEYEGKLAMLRDFPPLNYLFYPAVPEKYIVPVDNPWEATAEALAVMVSLIHI